jgi:diguanylate cyclase (GGDEF)-like protein
MRIVLVLVLSAAFAAGNDSARALLDSGIRHENQGQLLEAARAYEQAKLAAERSNDRKTLAEALGLLGYLQYVRGDINSALVNLQRGYGTALAIGDETAQRTLLTNIAHIYADPTVAQYDRAIEYYSQLLPRFEASGAAADVADTLFNIGSTYELKGEFGTALTWYRRALAAERKLGRPEESAYVKRSIGVTLGKLGRPAEALPLLNDALEVLTASGDRNGAMTVRQSRGVVQRRAGNYNAAIADLEATRQWYESQKNTRYLEKNEEELALAYALAGRWHDAYEARTRHADLQRQLAEKLREEHTSRLRVQFDADRKERENRELLRTNAAAARIRQLQGAVLVLGAAIIIVLAYLMVRLTRDKRRMRDMAMTDELTRLPNRRHLLAAADEQLKRARSSRVDLSLVAFDIDHFKRINDRWGHAAGDAVLQRVAHACRTALRPGDLIGRTGGEEFVAVLPQTTEPIGAVVAERLRHAVEATDFADIDPLLRVTISLGVVGGSAFDESLPRLLADADALLYRAKELGRNRVITAAAPAAP